MEAIGLPRVMEAVGTDKAAEYLLAHMPPEKLREMLEKVQQKPAQQDTGRKPPKE
jgi:hypothetical protein